jgi:hypothetical protein
MKTSQCILVFFLYAGVFHTGLYSQSLTAREIIQKADEKNRGESSQGEMTMQVVRPGWTREISMKTWSKGTEYFMIYITAPANEKGQTFLKRGTEMWNWVPSIERMIKLPPSMMMQSWMGSDFSNDDLVKQSSIVRDYQHKLLGEENIRGKLCYKTELIPNEEAPVVWGKIILWISKDGFDMWQGNYYDEDEELVHTEQASDIKMMGDRMIPTRIEIIPLEKEGHKTVLIIQKMLFNIPVDDSFFSQQNMKRIR